MKSKVSIKDKGYKSFLTNFTTVSNFKSADIGVFGDAMNAEGESIGDYARKNEFGYKHIPERSFLRSTYDEQRKKAIELLTRYIKKYCFERNVFEKGLNIAALYMVSKVKQKISSAKSWAKPNAPQTIAQKSKGKRIKDTPLINTGALRNSIKYKIK